MCTGAGEVGITPPWKRLEARGIKMQLQKPAQPIVLVGGECASLSAFRQKFSFWTQEGHTFPQEVSVFRDGTYPGEECFLGKKKNQKKTCPSVLII